MYLTTRNYNDIFDDMFRAPFFGIRNDVRKPANSVRSMRTNVKETENAYVMEVDLPGYDKEDIKAELKDGYLTITAEKVQNEEKKDENGKYIRQECYRGCQKRSFYVGEYLNQEDIQASFKNGVLELEVPKEKPPVEEPARLITIE